MSQSPAVLKLLPVIGLVVALAVAGVPADAQITSRQGERPEPPRPVDRRADRDAPSREARRADSDAAKREHVDEREEEKEKEKAAEEKLSVTQGSVTIGGVEIKYTATAGRLVMKSEKGDQKAKVFFIAYTKDGANPQENDFGRRPVTFCFNGGPGSSSVWLHLGLLGPRRVELPEDPEPVRPPYVLIPNQYSLLDVTDLVFIDPVSTGYSRPAKGEDEEQFHGYEEDLRSVGQFIHDYTTRFTRWSSPKFLIGESYGGLRAAGLAGWLEQRYRMYLNGIVLVSALVDFQTTGFGSPSNDLPYIVFLPSYSATAWYHEALAEDLQQLPLARLVRRAERFAVGEYAQALLLGDKLPAEQRDAVARQLARLTGLSPKYVKDANLRVRIDRFTKELLRSRRRTVGRYDSRYLGIDRDAAGESAAYDPSGAGVFGAFTATMNDYLRRTLQYEHDDGVYEILTGRVFPWNMDSFSNRYVTASEDLRQAMTSNPYLKVFAACGYYDLATPWLGMKYSRDHLALAPERRDSFSLGFYEAGHMMYVHESSLVKLRTDLVRFYEQALDTDGAPVGDAAD